MGNLAQFFLSSLLLDTLKLGKQLCCIILLVTANTKKSYKQNANSNLMSGFWKLKGWHC
jgi:hypothetical protein